MKYLVLVLALISCAHQPIVIPSDRMIEAAPGRPGYYIISAGHLQELHDQNLLLVTQLEKCKANKK